MNRSSSPGPGPSHPLTTPGGHYLRSGLGFEEARCRWEERLLSRGWPPPETRRAAVALAVPALTRLPDGTSLLTRTASRYVRVVFGTDKWPEETPRLVSHPGIADDLTLMMLAWFRALTRDDHPEAHDACDRAIGTALDPREHPYPLMPPAPLDARPGFVPDPDVGRLVASRLEFSVRHFRVFDPLPPRVRAFAVLSVYALGPGSHLRNEWCIMWYYALPSLGDRPDLVAEIAERSLRAYRRLAWALGQDPAETPDGLVLRWLTDLFEHWELGRPIPDRLWPYLPGQDDGAGDGP